MARLTPPALVKPRKRYMVKAVQDIVNSRFARHAKRLPQPLNTPVSSEASPVADTRSRANGKIKCLSKSRNGPSERTEVVGSEKRTYWDGMKLGDMRIRNHDAVCVKLSAGGEAKALVTSLFEVEMVGGQRDFKAHVHWLTSGPAAQPDELFLRHCQCDTIPLRAILAKVPGFQFRRGMADVNTTKPFARLVWHESECVWREPLSSAPCDSCHHRRVLAAHRADVAVTTWRADHFILRGEVFHVGEHVLVDSGETGTAWPVGVISGWENMQGGRVRLQVLLRHCDLKPGLDAGNYHDERELFLSCRYVDVPATSIARKTFLSERDSSEFFCRRDDRLQPLARALPSCVPCLAADTQRRTCVSQMLAKDKMPAVDLYSGGGGTIQGAKPFFKITHAVEIDTTACETLSLNHPSTEVLQERVAVLHHRALRHERDGFQVLGRVLPPKGSVFMLSAGPPCQGHSGANRHKDGEDLRNEELAHTISELSRVQADVFLLENVRGFTQDRSDGVFTDNSESSSFADMAVKMLIAIGYQCRVALLDSRAYGSPQRRVRCFVLAARSGVPLPSFPEPTHANPKPVGMRVSVGGDGKEVTVYSCAQWVTPGTGLYPPVTAQEAIGDLPAFDFALAGQASSQASNRRPCFSATVGHEAKATRAGFSQPIRYASAPQNSFQRRIRGKAQTVRDHYTAYLTPKQLDLVFGARTYVGDKDSSVPGSERMLRSDAGFYTLLTNPMPGGRTTGTIHWAQKRTFTIAERRRAMGFPDDYVFAGTPPQVDHQLGNAMVVNLMECIYRQILEDTVLPWWIVSGKPDDLMRAWRRDHPVE